jgi:hypothetical protein
VGFFSDPVEINDKGICVLFFFFPKTIHYSEIKSIRSVSLWKALLETINPLKPPLYFGGTVLSSLILIETKNLRFIVSPKDGDHFVRMVLNRLRDSNSDATLSA